MKIAQGLSWSNCGMGCRGLYSCVSHLNRMTSMCQMHSDETDAALTQPGRAPQTKTRGWHSAQVRPGQADSTGAPSCHCCLHLSLLMMPEDTLRVSAAPIGPLEAAVRPRRGKHSDYKRLWGTGGQPPTPTAAPGACVRQPGWRPQTVRGSPGGRPRCFWRR